ncbi:Glyoxalase/Bleomycin resistance protein/Dioxygenase superfamily [Bacillus cereus BDRD-Cer4]|nr:Glyoxalase/Bleomycin resistance protein/Dioxygenase superfamily [Bacillus cereus BDRD-Cer4]
MIKVQNLEESITFYSEQLRLQIIWEYDNYVGFHNGIVIHDSKNSENLTSFFKVDSVEETVKILKESNVKIILEPTPIPTGYTAAFQDISNNIIHIVDNINLS